MNENTAWLKSLIRDVPDFPKEGIVFKDITTLVRDPRGLSKCLDMLSAPFVGRDISAVAGMESRGFIFGVPVAERLGCGFVPIRKPGKLPAETVSEEYELEYGIDKLEMHRDATGPRDNVLVVDDLLATGGTANAAVKLVRSTGAKVAGVAFVIELAFLRGRDVLDDVEVHSLIVY